MVEIFSRTSVDACWASFSRLNSAMITDTPSDEVELMFLMPLIALSDVLDRLGDLRFDLLGADAGVDDGHGDDRQRDVGHHVDAEAGVGDQAQHHDQGDDHGDEDRLA